MSIHWYVVDAPVMMLISDSLTSACLKIPHRFLSTGTFLHFPHIVQHCSQGNVSCQMLSVFTKFHAHGLLLPMQCWMLQGGSTSFCAQYLPPPSPYCGRHPRHFCSLSLSLGDVEAVIGISGGRGSPWPCFSEVCSQCCYVLSLFILVCAYSLLVIFLCWIWVVGFVMSEPTKYFYWNISALHKELFRFFYATQNPLSSTETQ